MNYEITAKQAREMANDVFAANQLKEIYNSIEAAALGKKYCCPILDIIYSSSVERELGYGYAYFNRNYNGKTLEKCNIDKLLAAGYKVDANEISWRKEAVCLLLEVEDKVLAVARRGTEDQWGLPGGKVDDGESLEDALSREVEEETGISLDLEFVSKVFERIDDKYHVTTFRSVDNGSVEDWEFMIENQLGGDAGPVKLVTWEELCSGPFGEYNKKLKESLETSEVLINE